MGRRAHAPTDLYVRSGDTSGLIVIIAHASVNALGACIPPINISSTSSSSVRCLLHLVYTATADPSVCLSVSVRCHSVIFATQCTLARVRC